MSHQKVSNAFLFIFLIFSFFLGHSQTSENESNRYLVLVRPAFDGTLAYNTTEFVAQYWRVPGNTGFNKSVDWIASELEKAGYVLESEAQSTSRLTYRIESRPMDRPTWEPVSAQLSIVGESTPLLVSSKNRNMTFLNSVSTPQAGITAEVIYIKPEDDLSSMDLKDKVVFIESGIRSVYKQLLGNGVLGVLSYDNPDYLQPEKNVTSIQFRSLPSQTDTKFWGIALSFEAKERLQEALKKGRTKVTVNIQTKIYTTDELTVIANIKGSKNPQERLVFSAHIQEPGANDNASGVGTQLEMATIAASLIEENKLDVDRTLTFLWGDEISSTHRYIQEDKERAKGIKWGISLDMVGENTDITGGSFLIEKMPDPSAIWTRGQDKHTEWGGEVLALEDMKPHYLNDFIIHNFKEQGNYANWKVNTNPFEGGSDHTPFLKSDIPGLLLWHFTDQFYHTDNDRIDKVSQETLKNVGTAALASGLYLVNANTDTANEILNLVEKSALKRLESEFELSIKSTLPADEKPILAAWEDWYLKALQSITDLEPLPTKDLQHKIKVAQQKVRERTQNYLTELDAR
ncbi:M28 family peptidase [Maribacter sp. PR1]|uniref:M28 family peptidase n=1 Tax=Maribacter cobaltidurans TaxID=1178778 RepID=A0ABU7J016_9FLAO|nr:MULTISPECIES: M28 family peptidase [Maribacter]MDC6391042.1 M28 family peptidase [Maribacter sp. PR1]MEE1978434.1 M28 family peptidase [Maribacter cobaltidurans]